MAIKPSIILTTLLLLFPLTASHFTTTTNRAIVPSPARHCRPRRLFRTTACLCYIALSKRVITPSLSAACKKLFKRSPAGLQPRCSNFVNNGNIRALRAVGDGRRAVRTCFKEGSLVIPPGADMRGPRGGVPLKRILKNLIQIKALLNDLLAVLDVMFVLPSSPARVVVVGEGRKTMRLVNYNNLANRD